MRLRNVTSAYILLERESDFFVFLNDSHNVYINPDGVGKIYRNVSTGMSTQLI